MRHRLLEPAISDQVSVEVDRLADMHPFALVLHYNRSGSLQSIVDWNQKIEFPGKWLIEVVVIPGIVVWTAKIVVDVLKVAVYVCSAECEPCSGRPLQH